MAIRPSSAWFITVVLAFLLWVVTLPDASPLQAATRADAIPGNTVIQSFSKSKKLLHDVFAGHERTFYGDCRYQATSVDLDSCGYQSQKPSTRARQLEWAHVVQAEAFAHVSTRKGRVFKRRTYAREIAIPFRSMEADLCNLQPAIREVSRLRAITPWE